MGLNSSKRKAETLGMPHGTANGKLRKSILFKYVSLAGDNFCYQCGAEITSEKEFSIEHKKPWEGISLDLFFDLDNIAFSHVQCNRPHNPSGGPKKIVTPEGMNWCCSCKSMVTTDQFYKDVRRLSGLQSYCIPCHRELRKSWSSRRK